MIKQYMEPMPLERKVHDIVPTAQNTRVIPDLFGVEVEVEGYGKLTPIDPVWSLKEDGSLRAHKAGDYCKEFVFSHPLNFAATTKAVELLINYLTDNNRKVYDSERTSIHVHVNFAADIARTVYNFITLALIFDEAFVSLHAAHRVGNNFCLRAKDAAGQVVKLVQSVQNGMGFSNLGSEERYSSINFVSLLKFGTVEFRSMETNTDLRRILNWISLIKNLKHAAYQFKNPTEIIAAFSQFGPTEFLHRILPTSYHLLDRVGTGPMLTRGVRIAQDFAYCSAWNEAKESDQRSPGQKKVAQYMDMYGVGPAMAANIIKNEAAIGVKPENPMYVLDANGNLPAAVKVKKPKNYGFDLGMDFEVPAPNQAGPVKVQKAMAAAQQANNQAIGNWAYKPMPIAQPPAPGIWDVAEDDEPENEEYDEPDFD